MKNIFKFQPSRFINFVGQSKYAFIVALILIFVTITSLVKNGLNYGIDFLGGVLIEVENTEVIDMADMRAKTDQLNIGEVNLQSLGISGKEMIINVSANPNDEGAQARVVSQLKETLGPNVEYRRVEVVGPKVGDELFKKSFWASVFALLAISIYIWIRFEWQFSFVCLLALGFDLFITVGLFSLTGLDFNMTVIAGLLSLAGYTTNDKVVNFDRVRENLKLYRKMPTPDLLNKSLNDTLSRTLLTSITTMLVLVVLLLLGGSTLACFSICLLFGIVVGTLSSIYLAVPLLRFFNIRTIGARATEIGPYAEAAQFELKAKEEGVKNNL